MLMTAMSSDYGGYTAGDLRGERDRLLASIGTSWEGLEIRATYMSLSSAQQHVYESVVAIDAELDRR